MTCSGSVVRTSSFRGWKEMCCVSDLANGVRPLSDSQLLDLGRQAMTALAQVHRLDPAQAPYLGEPVPFEEDVTRWDRLFERAADPQCLSDAPVVRQKTARQHSARAAPVGIFSRRFSDRQYFFVRR